MILNKYASTKRIWIWLVVIVSLCILIGGKCVNEFAEKSRKEKLYEELQEDLKDVCPGIICWGDSLTVGTGGDGVNYPDVLEKLIQEKLMPEALEDVPVIEVINMGVGGEDTNTILGRNGAVPFVVSEDFVIPEGKEAIDIMFSSANGKNVAPLRQDNAGMESVEINGVLGEIQVIQGSYTSNEYSYTFTRSKSGDAVEVLAGTPIITSGAEIGTDYWTVIFIGENGGYDTPAELIKQQRAIIEHQTANNEKYIIVGLHTGTAEEREGLEKAMAAEYGEKYINLREYLCTEGLETAGLKGTEEDIMMMQRGMTPASLMIEDKCHFNEHGYRIIGKLIFDRMDQLGYFEQIKNTVEIIAVE